MEFLKRLVLLLVCFNVAVADDAHILYYLKRGLINQAIVTYQEDYKDSYDSELIQEIGSHILLEGLKASDAETQVMAIFGAGISLNERMLTLLEKGISSSIPQIQLVTLNFLAGYKNDRADEMLLRAMGSDFLAIRLEAALHLAEKRYPTIVDHIDALFQKVPKQIHPLFPQYFAMIGTADATKTLRKLLVDSNEQVRIEAIRNIGKFGRDDLISKVRTQATHHNPIGQEVCAATLGLMKDEHSIPQLERLSKSKLPAIRLAALNSLYHMGRKEKSAEIIYAAQNHNLFAIHLLSKMPEAVETLCGLLDCQNLQVKINAAIALLEHQDPRCLQVLCEVLIQDGRDLGLSRISTLGNTLSAYKVIHCATEHFKDKEGEEELSLSLKEALLAKTVQLPENDFLNLAHTLFECHQNPLISTLVHLLEKLQTTGAVDLLKKNQQKAGAPLIRNYCNLALYRLKEKGPYLDNLKAWVSTQHNQELIRFRPVVEKERTTYHLTPEETSRLLVESFEAIAQMQEKDSIDIILKAILEGNQKNKYALAGLLIRAAQ